jgi:hypothetical protein
LVWLAARAGWELRASSYELKSRRPAAEKRRGWADEGVCPYVSLAPGRRRFCLYVSLDLNGCKTMPLKVERDID